MDNETPLVPSTLENIDTALFRYIDETLNPLAVSNKGSKKVNVLWIGTERAYQVKENKELRDSVGRLKLPLITVGRTSVSRDDDFKGAVQAVYGGERIDGIEHIAVKRVIKQDKTQNYQNSYRRRVFEDDTGPVSSKKVVYETYYMPRPTYLTCMFEANIQTEYQQQINEILPYFINNTKNYCIIENDGYKYETFIQSDYSINSNSSNLEQSERMFSAKIQFKVLGYINNAGQQSSKPAVSKKESVVEVHISRERVIVGDEKPWSSNSDKYRDL